MFKIGSIFLDVSEICKTDHEDKPIRRQTMFYSKLHKLINKHAPLVPVSKRKAKLYCKPWITKGIRKSITIKNSLFYSGNSEKYKYYRNKILTLTRIRNDHTKKKFL